ncbi:hypothetical protein BCR43DRAFT_525240 [Syncephalastrum racemosum]|uniref:Cysteine-rich transmembrane CYSTM domain-containing protein n=1 Tax=Syncephalastrum racemosum TaxID=13706 RepID=A0A1X2HA48_SYNRA|nr:hypothetical protein BCR43DRAFT_525240 [Syncephalastrum racemosum]
MSQEQAAPAMSAQSYPAQTMAMDANVNNNAAEQLQKQDEAAQSSMLRLRGGGCVKDCLATICCCCALEAICWYVICELDEICC